MILNVRPDHHIVRDLSSSPKVLEKVQFVFEDSMPAAGFRGR